MGHQEWVELLDNMERDSGRCPFLAVIKSNSRPWVKKYVWLAAGPAPEKPKEVPDESDLLFLAVRNPSLCPCTVEFECESQHGRIKFDKSDTGFKVVERLQAVPAREFTSVPVTRNTRIMIEETGESSEVILVRAATFEESSRKQLGGYEVERIVISFI